jgi:hypothetical protein
MDDPFSLPALFWDRFAAEYWDRQPGAFANVVPPIVTEDELMPALRIGLERLAHSLDRPPGPGPGQMRLYVDQKLVFAPEFHRFMKPGDSLQEYSESLAQEFGGAAWAIVVNDLHRYVPNLLQRLMGFLAPLIERIGIPARLMESSLFVGNYRYTPFGIHQDPGNGVVNFCISGEKTILTWPPDYFLTRDPELRLRKPDPEHYLSDAIAMEIRPGDMMYWPPFWYHCGFSERQTLSAAFGIGFWNNFSVIEGLHEALRAVIAQEFGSDANYFGYHPRGDQLPDWYERALELLRSPEIHSKIQECFRRQWKARVDAMGFSETNPLF